MMIEDEFGVCLADTFVVKMDNHSHYLTLSDLGDLKHSMPGGADSAPCLSLLLLEIWQPNLAQRLFII